MILYLMLLVLALVGGIVYLWYRTETLSKNITLAMGLSCDDREMLQKMQTDMEKFMDIMMEPPGEKHDEASTFCTMETCSIPFPTTPVCRNVDKGTIEEMPDDTDDGVAVDEGFNDNVGTLERDTQPLAE